jgi:hypothetical protein
MLKNQRKDTYYSWGKHSEVTFMPQSQESEVRRLIRSGYRVYSLPWVRERILWEWGYDIVALGVKPLALPDEVPQRTAR